MAHSSGRKAQPSITAWRAMLTGAGGGVRIWSLRVRRGDKVRHVLTIEVDLERRAVVQARGWGNRAATGKPLRLFQDWTVGRGFDS